MVTAEQFFMATGFDPHDDDLERANCQKAGQPGHTHCGWDKTLDLPEFIAVAVRCQKSQAIELKQN
jgi:hypothetical protein